MMMRYRALDDLVNTLGPRRPVMAPADQTARPTAGGSGVMGALNSVLRTLSEWDTRAGRDLAARMPAGTTLANATIPDYIGGPKVRGMFRHGSTSGVHGFERDAPTFFTSNPESSFVNRTPAVAKALVQMDNPITLPSAASRIDDIASAFSRHGVPPDEAAEVLSLIRRGDDPQAFFNISPKMAAAYRSLGYDGAYVDRGLVNGEKWAIPFSNKGIKAHRWSGGK